MKTTEEKDAYSKGLEAGFDLGYKKGAEAVVAQLNEKMNSTIADKKKAEGK